MLFQIGCVTRISLKLPGCWFFFIKWSEQLDPKFTATREGWAGADFHVILQSLHWMVRLFLGVGCQSSACSPFVQPYYGKIPIWLIYCSTRHLASNWAKRRHKKIIAMIEVANTHHSKHRWPSSFRTCHIFVKFCGVQFSFGEKQLPGFCTSCRHSAQRSCPAASAPSILIP